MAYRCVLVFMVWLASAACGGNPGAPNGSTVTESWGAGGVLGSGTLTIATLTATGASGTFRFDGVPMVAGSTGTRVVTNGAFRVTF